MSDPVYQPTSSLPVATGISGSDEVVVNQGGVTKRAAASLFSASRQAASAELDAVSAWSGTGIIERTGGHSFAFRTISPIGRTFIALTTTAQQRTAMELGTAAIKDTPATGNATSGQAVLGSDTRLSDARTPLSHTHVLASITDAGSAAGKNVASSGNASSSQVVMGNDTRLTDARAIAAHKTSHTTGGTDALIYSDIGAAAASHTHVLASITNAGTAASRNAPASGDAAVSEVVLGSDTRLTNTRTPAAHTQTLSTITDAGTAASKNVAVTGDATSGQVVMGNDSRLSAVRTPAAHKISHSTGGTDALVASDIGAAATVHTHLLASITDAGSAAGKNAPGAGVNAGTTQVVAGDDTRLTDDRYPTTHKNSHALGGTDILSPADIGAAQESHAGRHATAGADPISPFSIGAANATHTHVTGDISGLGTIATQSAAAVSLTGGTIDGPSIVLTSVLIGASGIRTSITNSATVPRAQSTTDAAGKVPVFDSASAVPSTSTSAGKKGESRQDGTNYYFCIADNTWIKWAVTSTF